MFALGHHNLYHSVGRSSSGSWVGMGSTVPLPSFSQWYTVWITAVFQTLFLSPFYFFKIFFPGILSWAVSLKQLTLIHFQLIVWHSFVCAFLAIFSPKASRVRRTAHCWSCIFSTETPHVFHADKREGVWPFLIPDLSLCCSLSSSPRKVEDLSI